VSPSRHSPSCWIRWVTATRRLVTAVPVLSLRTDDCAAEAERLKAKGVVFVMEPYRWDDGGIDAVFTDTGGNLLNLHQG
jgi:predicted enzyme related to lactoylglutathione lyase